MAILGFIFALVILIHLSAAYIAVVWWDQKISGEGYPPLKSPTVLAVGCVIFWLWIALFKLAPFTITAG